MKTDKRSLAIYVAILALGLVLGVVQPWLGKASGEARTIAVQGDATVSAMPDEYVFYPTFSSEAKTNIAAREAVMRKGEKALDDIKKLGINESDIKVDITAYEDYKCFDCSEPTGYNASYSMTINVDDKELADKLQTYLSKSDAEGMISPQASFSEEKLDQIKSDARAQALEKARAQATQIASELEGKLGKPITIEEVQGFDSPIFYAEDSVSSSEGGVARSSDVLTGEQEITFSLKATFELK